MGLFSIKDSCIMDFYDKGYAKFLQIREPCHFQKYYSGNVKLGNNRIFVSSHRLAFHS